MLNYLKLVRVRVLSVPTFASYLALYILVVFLFFGGYELYNLNQNDDYQSIIGFEGVSLYWRVYVTAIAGMIGAAFVIQKHEMDRLEFFEKILKNNIQSFRDIAGFLVRLNATGADAIAKSEHLESLMDLYEELSSEDEVDLSDEQRDLLREQSKFFDSELEGVQSSIGSVKKSYLKLMKSPLSHSILAYMRKSNSRHYRIGAGIDYLNTVLAKTDGVEYEFKLHLHSQTYAEFAERINELAEKTQTEEFVRAFWATGLKPSSPIELMGIVLASNTDSEPKAPIKLDGVRIEGVVLNIGMAYLLEFFELLPKKRLHIISAISSVFELPVGSRIKRVLDLMRIGSPNLIGAPLFRELNQFSRNPERLIWFYGTRKKKGKTIHERVYYNPKSSEHRQKFAYFI